MVEVNNGRSWTDVASQGLQDVFAWLDRPSQSSPSGQNDAVQLAVLQAQLAQQQQSKQSTYLLIGAAVLGVYLLMR